MKKIMFSILIALTLLLVACGNDININVDGEITVYLNEPLTLEVQTNDKKGLTYTSLSESIFTVDENGVVKGLIKGQGFLTIRAKSDTDVSVFVSVNVKEKDFINPLSDLSLKIGESKQLNVTGNFESGVSYTSSNDLIVSVSESGLLTAVSEGDVIITVVSVFDSSIKVSFNVIVAEASTIDVAKEVSLTRNETLDLNAVSDIAEGLSYVSLNENIVTIDANGKLTGINKGSTTVKVISKLNVEVYKEVKVTVNQLEDAILEVMLSLEEIFLIGNLVTNPTYVSSNELVALVNQYGVVNAVGLGETTIKVANKEDANIYEEVVITVGSVAETLNVSANENMLLGSSEKLNVEVGPVGSNDKVYYRSLNESVLIVSDTGVVTALSPGSAGIRINSASNVDLFKTVYISVFSMIIVDASKSVGDKVEYLGYSFEYGVTMYSSINEALEKAVNNTEIIVYDGIYEETLIVDKKVNLQAIGDAVIDGKVVIASSNVTIDGFTIKNGSVSSITNILNVAVLNNKFIDVDADNAIKLSDVNGINVSYNEISFNVSDAILITGINSGNNYIKGNVINGGNAGIIIISEKDYDLNTIIDVMWNQISNVLVALEVDLGLGNNVSEIRQVVRFNNITNYDVAIKTNELSYLDLNLNYWGVIDINKFINVNHIDLNGFYTNPEEIVVEANYDSRVPVKIEILNKIDEIEVGIEHTIEYVIYPKELGDNTVRWLYSNVPALEINGPTVKGLYSWDVVITLRAREDQSIFDSFTLSVTTDPYLDFVPIDPTYSSFYVGNSFKINVNVVPYQIRNEKIIYETSDPLIASVTEGGIVNLLSSGDVTLKVYLEKDENIGQEFKFKVFDELDKDDPFGFALSTMVNYAAFRSWNVYGVNFDYQAEFLDSVSRILIGDIEVNDSLIVPADNTYIRPGGPRPEPVNESDIFNDDYVRYVVVHETAGTDEGMGAKHHAQYLYNNPERQASWHYTVDDKDIYQSIPLNEMAWHAGDGRRAAGTTWISGKSGGITGGNANGIGIETSVALGDDIVSTWHRTARIAAKLSKQFNLPENEHRGNVKFHQDFDGKVCPQSIIRGNLVDFFYGLVNQEYIREYKFAGLTLSINSHNTEYLNNNGRVIKYPPNPMTVSYDLTITYNEESRTETMYVYIPGQVK